ncbi:MAG: HEAT repeat domain-containing protein [Planctomycetaceae bacterium]|nr:HEAT repeat domain-containing protein [Planctomycetaceae bacterium]
MKSIRTLATVVAVFGLGGYAQAGLLDHLFGHGGGSGCCDTACDASKCCECAPTCEPECCKPVIIRPQQNVYLYQRQLSCLKPPACHDPCVDPCVDPCCDPCLTGADVGVATCGPNGECCAPKACFPCNTPVGEQYAQCPTACGPSNHNCAGNCNGECGPNGHCCPTDPCCPADPCCPGEGCERDYEEACEVAQLIYQAQTACDAEDREAAVDDLTDYDVCCYPEIMATLLYSLNDADPEVREEAADELGDVFEDHPEMATQCVIDHLTCALADCNDDVVAQVEEALEQAGYEIVDACDVDDVCCVAGTNCAPGCAPSGYAPATQPAQPAPMPMNGEGAAPAPAPPQDTKAYFPRTAPQGQPARKFSLSKLFSMN